MRTLRILCVAMGLSLPGAALAEGAGLFWDNSAETKLRSGADWGTQAPGSSALGQLEGITGQKVDRSTEESSLPGRPAQVIKRAPSAKARSDAAAMEAMAAGILVFSVLQAIDAQADAQARAAAEAERQRQLEAERQRQLRLQAAARQRAAWEAQDAQDSADLGAALSGNVHSSFFGSGPAIDPATVAGKLPGASAAQVKQEMVPPYMPPPPLPPQVDLLTKGQELVKEKARELVRKAIFKSLPSRLKNSKEAVEYVERVNDWTNDLFKALDPSTLVAALADRDPAASHRILDALDRSSAAASDLSGHKQVLDLETRVSLLRIGSGRYPPREEVAAWAAGKIDSAGETARESLIDKLTGNLFGDDDE